MVDNMKTSDVPPRKFDNNLSPRAASTWGVDMKGMFHRNMTEAIMDKEVSQCLVKGLPWENNTLIEEADSFISSCNREEMIKRWAKDEILRHQGDDKYEWMEKSKAPNPLERTTWSESPGITAAETFEARIAAFFNEITHLTIKFNNDLREDKFLRIWRPFNREKIEKMRNPDIVLVKDKSQTVKWADVISTIEVKWKDLPELFQKAIGQLGDVAALVFHHQERRQWFPCLSLCGTSLRMSVFTRGGSLHTVPLDILKDVALFTKVMNYFTHADLTSLGYDNSIFKVTGQCWDPEERPRKDYESVGKLFISTGLYGKGTRVFALKDTNTGKHVVIKDCWDPSETVSDRIVHSKLQDPTRDRNRRQYILATKDDPNGIMIDDNGSHPALDYVAQYNDSHADPWADGKFLRGITIMEKSMWSNESIRSISAKMGYSWDASKEPILDDRYRHRTMFNTCGVDIMWFGTARELFHGLVCAVIGHQNAYEKREILHGDVSDGNTLLFVDDISEESAVPLPPENPPAGWTPLRHGMTSDWGSAADCRDEQDKERLRRTGTLPFESNQSLMGEPVEYHHDLQSYFWLAYLITCNCAGPFNMRRDWNEEIARDNAGQRITPTLINNLAEIKTRGGDWMKVAEDHALDSKDRSANPGGAVPVNYLSWVRPGVHALTPADIVNQRAKMSDDDFANLMTPYFLRHGAIQDGLLKLRELFLGPMERHSDGFRRRRVPTQPVTYDQMISILTEIRDNISSKVDTYPDAKDCENARARYRRSLKSGNRMPLMAEEDEEEPTAGSSKRVFSEPDGLRGGRAPKRARGRSAGRGAVRGAVRGARTRG